MGAYGFRELSRELCDLINCRFGSFRLEEDLRNALTLQELDSLIQVVNDLIGRTEESLTEGKSPTWLLMFVAFKDLIPYKAFTVVIGAEALRILAELRVLNEVLPSLRSDEFGRESCLGTYKDTLKALLEGVDKFVGRGGSNVDVREVASKLLEVIRKHGYGGVVYFSIFGVKIDIPVDEVVSTKIKVSDDPYLTLVRVAESVKEEGRRELRESEVAELIKAIDKACEIINQAQH